VESHRTRIPGRRRDPGFYSEPWGSMTQSNAESSSQKDGGLSPHSDPASPWAQPRGYRKFRSTTCITVCDGHSGSEADVRHLASRQTQQNRGRPRRSPGSRQCRVSPSSRPLTLLDVIRAAEDPAGWAPAGHSAPAAFGIFQRSGGRLFRAPAPDAFARGRRLRQSW